MTVLGISCRCVVCGTCAVVIVAIDDVAMAYCSRDWLAVELDGIPANAAISWVNDPMTIHEFSLADADCKTPAL